MEQHNSLVGSSSVAAFDVEQLVVAVKIGWETSGYESRVVNVWVVVVMEK